jgi:hypothetical protein
MKSFRVDKDTDIAAYVRHVTILHDSTRVYRFSKELLALIETLVSFSPYYVANDPRAAGPIDIYYNEALNEYASITYDVLNDFIIEGLQEWYQKWPPNPEFDLDGADGDAIEVPDVAGPASASVGYSTTRRTAGPTGGAAEGTPPPERAAGGANAATTPATPK